MTIDLLQFVTFVAMIACVASGLLAGALVTEACVLVPYWRTMHSADFLKLHSTISPLLFRFYAPITVAGTLLPVVACTILWITGGVVATWWVLSALCAVALLGFYFGFFQKANKQFADGLPAEEQPKALERWAAVHKLRTIVAVAGFGFAAAALVAT